jgi:predicted alpha/beta hydrolase
MQVYRGSEYDFSDYTRKDMKAALKWMTSSAISKATAENLETVCSIVKRLGGDYEEFYLSARIQKVNREAHYGRS